MKFLEKQNNDKNDDKLKETLPINNNLIEINYPNEDNTMVESLDTNIINNSLNYLLTDDTYLNNDTLESDNNYINASDNQKGLNEIIKEKDEEYEGMLLETIKSFEKTSESNLYDYAKDFYNKAEDIDIINSSNYNNEHFCYCCKNYMILPDYEKINFLNFHLSEKKYSKYLILVFRLYPQIFSFSSAMNNCHIRKYILNYLNLNDKIVEDETEQMLIDLSIFNKYENVSGYNLKYHIYENLFHQPNLKYCDYIKCDNCKNYLCPKHVYLSNCYYNKCNICFDRFWTICGWCKTTFNEELACKYIHKK